MATPHPRTTTGGLVAEIDRLRAECADLEAARRTLMASLACHAEKNAALRASALLWIDLYERQVRRANALAEALLGRTHPRTGSGAIAPL